MNGRSQKGFTLVELVVTISILGVLAALAVPSMIGVMPRLRLGSRASTLANSIASTRMTAIATSTEFQFLFNPAGEAYTIQKRIGGAWTSIGRSTLGDTDLVSATGFDVANRLVLSPMGAASVPLGGQGVVFLQTEPVPPAAQGDHQRQILVEATGRVIVQKRTIGGSWVTE